MKVPYVCALWTFFLGTTESLSIPKGYHNKNVKNVKAHNDEDCEFLQSSSSRRDILHNLAVSVCSTATTALLYNPSAALALVEEKQRNMDNPILPSFLPTITHKVNFNVRISRADGTFYVRDDPPDVIPTPDNQVFTGTITVGLYGTHAPNHVSKFLQYADSSNYDPLEDFPLPSYSKSIFTTFIQSNGVLIGGSIPGLSISSINGASALEYRGRVIPASLWIDDFTQQKAKIPHFKKGLITHRNLDVLPNFGITTREANELNGSHTVFGEIIPTDSSNAFFSRIVDLPTYSMSTDNTINNPAVGEVASSFYSFQKDLFRSAAKTFGDTRLDNIYEGKILRRVEVTSVSVEKI